MRRQQCLVKCQCRARRLGRAAQHADEVAGVGQHARRHGPHLAALHEAREALTDSLPPAARAEAIEHAPFRHVLTHRDLDIHIVSARLPGTALGDDGRWFTPHEWPALGLPAPIRRFLQEQV